MLKHQRYSVHCFWNLVSHLNKEINVNIIINLKYFQLWSIIFFKLKETWFFVRNKCSARYSDVGGTKTIYFKQQKQHLLATLNDHAAFVFWFIFQSWETFPTQITVNLPLNLFFVLFSHLSCLTYFYCLISVWEFSERVKCTVKNGQKFDFCLFLKIRNSLQYVDNTMCYFLKTSVCVKDRK